MLLADGRSDGRCSTTRDALHSGPVNFSSKIPSSCALDFTLNGEFVEDVLCNVRVPKPIAAPRGHAVGVMLLKKLLVVERF